MCEVITKISVEVDMKAFKPCIIFLIYSTFVWASWSNRYTTFGQWQIPETNWGQIGGYGDYYLGYWPRGSGHNYIYGAGIWVGGILPNGDTVVSVGYDPHNAEHEYAPGIPYSNPVDPQWRVYFSTDPDYPFVPISVEDGYANYNDFDTLYHVPDSIHVPEPLGITITQKTYVWPADWADDVVFIKYIIKNDTTYTINDLYAGFCLDYDIGNESGANANDRYGGDLSRKLSYGWQDVEEQGWSGGRGMLGIKLLSSFSLSSMKRLTLNLEPGQDRERYLVMAGYNYHTYAYEPFDTIWSPPDDQRMLVSTGSFTLAPGDSVILDWALIAGHDPTPPSPDLEYKADRSQSFYEAGPYNVNLIAPNGGETISGIFPITYLADSITPNALYVNFYLISENGVDTIALGQNNTGTYNWNTALFPDGLFYKVMVIAHDNISMGGDVSDDCFTINNPGNASPFIQVISPQNFDTLSGNFDITWFARDPEFLDSLFINIYFESQYDTVFQAVASNESNDGIYTWNTYPYRNGSGLLVVETHDEEFSVAETTQVYLLNLIPGGDLNHTNGLNNTVNISVLLHQPNQITGHTYELEFLQYRALYDTTTDCYFPEYIYELRDSNIGITVLDTYSLKNGYTVYAAHIGINDFSPIIDGFSIRAYAENENVISIANFHNDSIKVILGNYPEDSINLYGSTLNVWWAYRGSRLQLDWVKGLNGGLSIFVTDLDYGDTIPYKPYGNYQNPDSAFGWCFHRISSDVSSDTLRVSDRLIYLCGDRIYFSRSVPPPQVGDRWLVYPSEYSPPIKGNIYHFTPTGISESKNRTLGSSFHIYPVPCINNLTIAYTLRQTQKVRLVIYDVMGRKVKNFRDGIESPGVYNIFWNGLDDRNQKVSSGVYFCRFETDKYKDTKKIVMLK